MKNLTSIAKRIAEFSYDNEHKEIKEVVMEAAREHRCEPGAIRLQGIDYPEDFEWECNYLIISQGSPVRIRPSAP